MNRKLLNTAVFLPLTKSNKVLNYCAVNIMYRIFGPPPRDSNRGPLDCKIHMGVLQRVVPIHFCPVAKTNETKFLIV